MLPDDFLDGLAEKSTDELRSLRDQCVARETSVSYVRRLVQGRADILVAELRRRLDGDDPPDSTELIARLPEILSDHHRPPGVGRLPQTLEPPDPDPELMTRLDSQVSPGELASLPELSEDRLRELLTALQDLENEVSRRRRELFRAIDTIQGELARRYQTGEESIETLLS